MELARPTRLEPLLAVAVFCLIAAAVVTDPGPPARSTLGYGFAVAFGAVLLLGRRWPVPVLLTTSAGIVLYYALDLTPIGLAAPVAPALYLAADRGRAFWAASIGGALLLLSVGARLVEGDDVSIVVGFDLGSEAALMLAVIALGDAVRNRRSLRAEFSRQAAVAAEERRREAARQVDAERVRIARELHDTLGHTMSVVSLQSAVAEEALADGAHSAVRTSLAAIRSAGAGAMSELRATVGTLRGETGRREPAPGIDQLAELADRITKGGLPVELRIVGELSALTTVAGATAYRVVQEALTNSLRHAHATRVTVTVCATASALTLDIVDDGRGAPPGSLPTEDGGHGLRGMVERVELLGGAVRVGNADARGYRVHADLPAIGTPT